MKNALLMLCLAACGVPPTEIDRPIEVVTPDPPVTPDLRRRDTPHTLSGVWTSTRVLKDETTLIDLKLDATTVFCTMLGYGANFLKVSIPQLDQLAHFDHRVEGTDLPCAAVGECSEQMNADNILQGNPGIEQVALRVVLTGNFELDAGHGTCRQQLIEDVSATIRGVPVHHHVEGEWEQVPLEVCEAP